MRIRTKVHINARTQDGRVYAAGEGTESSIDDDDQGMVGLMQSLWQSGQIEIAEDAGTVEETTPVKAESPAEPVAEPATDELDQLREQAAAAGVKVDGRWGADRLREEIAAAAVTE